MDIIMHPSSKDSGLCATTYIQALAKIGALGKEPFRPTFVVQSMATTNSMFKFSYILCFLFSK